MPEEHSPADGSTDIALDVPLTLSVTVTDPDGNSMDVSFFNASDDSPIGTDDNVASGGTAQISWEGLSSHTDYTWYAKADDGIVVTQSPTWTFRTLNNAPEKPVQKSPCGEDVQFSDEQRMVDLEVEVTDPDGDAMDVSFYDALDDSLIGTVPGVASGQTALMTWDLYDSTDMPVFSWYVKVTV